MRLFAAFLALVCLLSAAPAGAGELSVSLKTPAGKPVANAVVTVRPQSGVRGPIRFPWAYRVAQKDMQFDPFVLIVPVGAEVSFPNLDPFRHHVYSFSPTKVFELKLYSRDETRAVKFDKAGIVALGCNIHDDMSAFIRVVDTPYAGKTGPNGALVLRDVPPGPAVVTVWHPYGKAKGGEVSRPVTIEANGATGLNLAFDVRAAPVMRGMY